MATPERKSQRIGSVLGGALTLLAFASWIGGLNHAYCLLSAFFEIPLGALLDALSSLIQVASQLLVPCLFGHTRLLESLLQVTACGWQLVCTFAGAA